jgi:hypothetical protein
MKYVLIFLFLLSLCYSQAVRYGAINIRDVDGDSLTINNDGSINVSASGSEMYVIDNDGDTLELDNSTWAINTITYPHHEIHESAHFHIYSYDGDLDNGESLKVSIKVPDTTREAHFLLDVRSTDIMTYYRLENGSGLSGGDTATPVNNHRRSSVTSMLTFVEGGDQSDWGTKIDSLKWGQAGLGANTSAGGGVARDDELILLNDTITSYLFISGADNNIVYYKAIWYEHIPK